MACWAASLGGCEGGPSGEHIISRSQFDADAITVQGLPWCKTPRRIALKGFVGKNLCRAHNSALSPVDDEASKFKRAIDAFRDGRGTPLDVQIEARLVERWLLKTTINCALQEPGSGLEPSEDLVRRAYGLAPTPKGQGFFLVTELGERVEPTKSTIHFETVVRKPDKRIAIGVFVFHGIRAIYAFEGAPAVTGALRPRQVNWDHHRARFSWMPELATDDMLMA